MEKTRQLLKNLGRNATAFIPAPIEKETSKNPFVNAYLNLDENIRNRMSYSMFTSWARREAISTRNREARTNYPNDAKLRADSSRYSNPLGKYLYQVLQTLEQKDYADQEEYLLLKEPRT